METMNRAIQSIRNDIANQTFSMKSLFHIIEFRFELKSTIGKSKNRSVLLGFLKSHSVEFHYNYATSCIHVFLGGKEVSIFNERDCNYYIEMKKSPLWVWADFSSIYHFLSSPIIPSPFSKNKSDDDDFEMMD